MSTVTAEVMVERLMISTDKYVVFAARHEDGKSVRVRSFKHIDPVEGEMFKVSGRQWYRPDPNGFTQRQIDADEISRIRTSGALICRWLERLPHVGEKRSQRLREVFAGNLAEVLSDVKNLDVVAKAIDSHKPLLANKIATKIYSTIAARDAKHISVSEEIGFFEKLEGLGVTDNRAARNLWRLVGGPAAINRLLANPYLAASLMPWSKADHVGRALLKERTDKKNIAHHPDRLLGAVDSAWRDILSSGDTAATRDSFCKALEPKVVNVDEAIAIGISKRHIAVMGDLFRAPGAAWIEDDLLARLNRMEDAEPSIHTSDWNALSKVVAQAEEETSLRLHDEQRGAVQTLLTLPVGVLQGGAGVGKTTVMKVLVTAWESLGGNVVMGALAGKAALQLSRGTSTARIPRLAYTVARLLRMLDDKDDGADTKGIQSKLDKVGVNNKTLLILDEASMLDTPSLRQVVALLPLGARLLLVGDCAQLPPVGIGRVFHDLVEDGRRVVMLTTVRRQAHDSPVPSAAAFVRNGQLPPLAPWSSGENGIFWLDEPAKKIAGSMQVYDLYADLMKRSSDVMVVAALRATVKSFNDSAAGRRRFNNSDDDPIPVRLGPLASVTAGDPVVCTQNRYKESLFNGLLGHVTEANTEVVRVLWDGEKEPREVTKEIGADIELAYAITCHRAQGSAARYVIVLVEDSELLTREWLYTAITRTRETVIIVGSKEALERAVQRRSNRTTGFALLLKH